MKNEKNRNDGKVMNDQDAEDGKDRKGERQKNAK